MSSEIEESWIDKIKVVYYLHKSWGRIPSIKRCSHLPFTNNCGHLLFTKDLRLSSIYQKVEVIFHLQKSCGHPPFTKSWGRLPSTKKLRSSSNFKKIEVVFHLQKKLRSFSIYKKIEVVFHFKLSKRLKDSNIKLLVKIWSQFETIPVGWCW